MKTIKLLLRDWLNRSNLTKKENPTAKKSDSNQKPINTTLKTNQDETETDESAGIPVVDNPPLGENPGDDQGEKRGAGELTPSSSDSPSERKTQEETSSQTLADPQKDDPGQSEEDNETQKRIEEAYRKGLIDGKNARIEERFFPKNDDGIPNFRGRPQLPPPLSDIFSMAREA